MQSGKTKEIWKLLDTVPDPEIPVISVVELGVVRNISFTNNAYQILITPTYSGCPAVKTFIDDIKSCLKTNKIFGQCAISNSGMTFALTYDSHKWPKMAKKAKSLVKKPISTLIFFLQITIPADNIFLA